MRRIPRRPLSSPTWRRWISDCSTKAAQELAQQVARGEKPAVSDLYKRKSVKDEYFFAAGPPFYGKCAYCEAPIRDYQHGDVEHFRPKAGISDENGQPVYLWSIRAITGWRMNGRTCCHRASNAIRPMSARGAGSESTLVFQSKAATLSGLKKWRRKGLY